MEERLAGKLLVATPELVDPNFFRTVVLILEHDEVEGALGIVLNRATDANVADYLPEWAPFATPPLVHVGGPVAPEVAIGVVDTPATPPETWAPVVADIGLLDLSTGPSEVGGVLRARIFAGYAGWMAGQLEAELLMRSWFVVDAEEGDVFTNRPGSLWRTVLRRQPGRLAWYANFPRTWPSTEMIRGRLPRIDPSHALRWAGDRNRPQAAHRHPQHRPHPQCRATPVGVGGTMDRRCRRGRQGGVGRPTYGRGGHRSPRSPGLQGS